MLMVSVKKEQRRGRGREGKGVEMVMRKKRTSRSWSRSRDDHEESVQWNEEGRMETRKMMMLEKLKEIFVGNMQKMDEKMTGEMARQRVKVPEIEDSNDSHSQRQKPVRKRRRKMRNCPHLPVDWSRSRCQ